MSGRELTKEEAEERQKRKKEQQAQATNRYRSKFRSATFLTDKRLYAYYKALSWLTGIGSMQQLYNAAMKEYIEKLEKQHPEYVPMAEKIADDERLQRLTDYAEFLKEYYRKTDKKDS